MPALDVGAGDELRRTPLIPLLLVPGGERFISIKIDEERGLSGSVRLIAPQGNHSHCFVPSKVKDIDMILKLTARTRSMLHTRVKCYIYLQATEGILAGPCTGVSRECNVPLLSAMLQGCKL